jgi:transcriptional regulator with XRE-family HTH domain
MNDDRPAWARRITREREARGWSQAEVVTAMRMHAPKPLPDDASMLRQWKQWESGEHTPSEFYQPIVAATFGTVTHAMFPESGRRDGNAEILAASGMDTLELLSRMQATDLDDATIEALRLTTDRLCSDYPFLPSDQLLTEGRNWLRRLNALRGQRLTLAQHREILVLTGWLALLIGCVEYDSGRRNEAETTRRAALSLGTETDNAVISAWAHEMRAWMALTTGDYRGVVVAAQNGMDAAPITASRCSSRRRKPRHGLASVTGGRPKLRSTEAEDCWTARTTSTTISSWTRPSSTSTRWTATGDSATTRSPRHSLMK